MFSLIYTAAYDPYHTVFRFSALLKATPNKCMAARTLRVADFFLCFPWTIQTLRAPQSLNRFTKRRNDLLKVYQPTQYDILPDPRMVFERMEPIQIAAMSAMMRAELVKRTDCRNEETCLQEDRLGGNVHNAVEDFMSEHKELLSFLTENLPMISVFGSDGIFARSGLGEYRYDIV